MAAGVLPRRDSRANAEDMEKRLNALLETTTYTVFNYTRRCLFDKDKLIVSTMLTFSILLKDGKLNWMSITGCSMVYAPCSLNPTNELTNGCLRRSGWR